MEVTLTDLTENHKKINVIISKDEYLQERKKSIKKYQKTAVVPGFRPGTAPESLILKMYGNSLGVNEIYEKAYDAFLSEISKNQIKTLLEPIAGFHAESDFITGENIQVEFEFGIEPELSFDLKDILDETLFSVELTDQELEDEIQKLISENKKITEVNDDSEAQAFEIVLHSYLEGDQSQKKKDDILIINKEDISENRYQEFVDNFRSGNQEIIILDYLINKEDEKFNKLSSSKSFNFGRMIRFDDITIEELPEKIYPGKTFNSFDDFKTLLKSQIEQHYNSYNENLFIEKILIKLTQKVQNLPIDFISKWWISRENGSKTESFDEIKPYIINELSMRIIHNKLAEVLDIKITRDDVIEYFTKLYRSSVNENQAEAMASIIQSFIHNELSDSEKAKKMFDKTYEETLKSKLLGLKTNPYKITFHQMKEILTTSNQ